MSGQRVDGLDKSESGRFLDSAVVKSGRETWASFFGLLFREQRIRRVGVRSKPLFSYFFRSLPWSSLIAVERVCALD